MALHYDETGDSIHTPYRQEFADETARLAYTVTAADIAAGKRKKFLQLDDGSGNLTEWLPIATGAGADKWQQAGGSGSSSDGLGGSIYLAENFL